MTTNSGVPSRPRAIDDRDTIEQTTEQPTAQPMEPSRQPQRQPLRATTSAPSKVQAVDESDEALAKAAVAGGMASLRHANSAPESSTAHKLSMSASPKAERLPSFHQLSRIAADGEHDPRPTQTYPPPPPPSNYLPPPPNSAQSPGAPPQPYLNPPQISPTPTYGYHHQSSPTAMQNEPSPYYAASPTANMYSTTSHYPPPPPPPHPERRTSAPYTRPPATLISTLTSSSESSNRSLQSTGTGTGMSHEDWGTNHTTPIESTNSTPRQGLPEFPHLAPPPPNNVLGSFICDHPGCTAQPFQTQYLLNSHANVHSSSRPHYCPVTGCPRGEGGKGFKRKNEMIRHGLVHDSPGYMCPFCPDRDHRYPRPDNLQRHVRVHHIDKDKDDPILREVLNQRAEGLGRGRRRRTGP